MNNNDAFMIVEVEIQSDSEVTVKGRAYIDIRVGDILINKDLEKPSHLYNSYLVKKITSYGRVTPVLSTVMTGIIYLEGSHAEFLKDAKMLCKV